MEKATADSSTPKTTPVKSKSKSPVKSKTRTLAQAQQQAQANMASGSASFEQVHNFLANKKNRGKYFSPGQIAAGIGEGCTDKAVRKALQRAGLAKGKQAAIAASEKDWLALHKSGNRNTYTCFNAGSDLPVAQ